MKQEVFNLLDTINRRGIENDKFGFIQDEEVGYFGVNKDITLDGQWLYLYLNENDGDWEAFESSTNDIPSPKHELLIDSEGDFLFLYKL